MRFLVVPNIVFYFSSFLIGFQSIHFKFGSGHSDQDLTYRNFYIFLAKWHGSNMTADAVGKFGLE